MKLNHKKINITIHPGYAKTGTTFLQTKIFNKLGFVNLGKPHNIEDKLIRELSILQNQIFRPNNSFRIFNPKYSFRKIYPRNYSYLIKRYVSVLKNIISKKDNINFIWSDEGLFNHITYFGYFNLYLLKEIIELLNDYYETNIKFIISIRNQHEYLISYYAFNNSIVKKNFGSFDNFLNRVINDKDLSEIYQYDLLIKKIKKIFNSEILVLPLEELEHDYKNYINKIVNFLNVNIKKDIYDKTSVNKNSKFINGNKYYNIRTLNFGSGLYRYVAHLHISLKKFKIYEKNFKYLKFIEQLIKQLIKPKLKITGNVLLTEDQKRKIQKHFKKSNQNTEKMTNLNLRIYNYYE